MIDCTDNRELWFFYTPIYDDKTFQKIEIYVMHVVSKESILSSYWPYWIQRMVQLRRYNAATIENCINDFITTNWALSMEKKDLRHILETDENGVKVHFYKKDGTSRIMYCTLNPDLIPVALSGDRARELPHVLTVWDLEAEGWRNVNFSNEVDLLESDHV